MMLVVVMLLLVVVVVVMMFSTVKDKLRSARSWRVWKTAFN